jgi:serine/threonine protein kinase/Tol biopolymer transport system component
MGLGRGRKLGPYEVLEPLGAGGMGEVWKARDTRLDRIVAIKVSNEQFTERFQREAHAVAALNHPHICTLYDIGQQDGVDFLVMEYLEGQTLQARLSRGPLAAADVLRYAIEIADALALAHRHGISHRDLKPGNIMLTKGGAKLLDFGLAKLRECAVPPGAAAAALPTMVPTVTEDLTAKGTILGTFQYMAPEQLEGKPADSTSDIWAFGAVLYEMATGRKAFSGSSQASVIAAILTAQPQPISEQVSGLPALDHVVQKCLAKDPDERWQSAADLKSQFEWIAQGQQARPPESRTAHFSRRERAWMAATCLLLAVTAALGIAQFRHTREPARVVRFTFDLQPNTRLTPGEFPVVSPDGEHIAFTAFGMDSRTRLWERPVASLAPRLLPGTEGAYSPFWSPDGRQIGFFAEGKLKRVDLAGGLPQVLADAAGGGTWSRNGMVLFTPTSNSGINLIPADGGEAREVTTLDASSREISHRWPRFLPDGRHFIYFAESPQERAIYVASLDSRERKRVAAAQSAAVYAAAPAGPGYLLFLRNGALMAQRFDPGHAATLAEPLHLPEQVLVTVGVQTGAMPVVSASDNGVLAYRTGSRVAETQLAWFDRSGRRLNSVGEPGLYTNPAISPDGKKVAVGRGEPGKRDIWVYDLARETGSRFTFNPGDETNPAWSPDGSRIAFSSDRKGHRDIYIKSASGIGEEELYFESGENKSVEDWGRNGRFLLIYSLDRRGDEWLLPAPGAPGERKLMPLLNSEFIEVCGQLSPDGKWVLYVSNESGGSEVYVQAIPPAKGKWKISTSGGSFPRWSPHGKEIFYLAARNLMAVEIKSVSPGLQVGIPRILFEARLGTTQGRNGYDVSGDGQRFLMIVPVEETTTATSMTVVVNWLAALKQ